MPRANGSSRPDRPSNLSRYFGAAANKAARAAGQPATFSIAVAAVLIWAVTGPLFQFSDTWQLIINTSTTIITFLMVFLIQNSQNRDSAAIQVKLDELIRVSDGRNSLVGIEHLTAEEVEEIRLKCERRAEAETSSAGRQKKARKTVERAGK